LPTPGPGLGRVSGRPGLRTSRCPQDRLLGPRTPVALVPELANSGTRPGASVRAPGVAHLAMSPGAPAGTANTRDVGPGVGQLRDQAWGECQGARGCAPHDVPRTACWDRERPWPWSRSWPTPGPGLGRVSGRPGLRTSRCPQDRLLGPRTPVTLVPELAKSGTGRGKCQRGGITDLARSAAAPAWVPCYALPVVLRTDASSHPTGTPEGRGGV